MPYTAEVVVYPTGRSQEEMAYRAYVRVSPDGGDAQIISGEFGCTADQAKKAALRELKAVFTSIKQLLEE
jgi:hypothetical protein